MLSAVVFWTLADVFSTPGGVKPGVWKLSVSLARYSELTWRQLAKLEEPCCVWASFGFSFGHTACISCLSVQVLLSLKCACVFSESLTHKRLLQCAMMEVIIKKKNVGTSTSLEKRKEKENDVGGKRRRKDWFFSEVDTHLRCSFFFYIYKCLLWRSFS